MSLGMGVMDNHMVNTESSRLSNGNGSEEKRAVTVLHDGNPMARLKFKRRKVFAVRDWPPGCGPNAVSLRSRTQVKTDLEHASEAKVESSVKADDEQPCKDMDVAVTVEVKPEPEPKKKESDESLMVAPELRNLQDVTGDESMVEAMEVQPLSICLPEDAEEFSCVPSPLKDVRMGSVGGQSVVRTTEPHRRKVPVTSDLPSKAGKNLFIEKLGSNGSSDRTQSIARDAVFSPNEERKDLNQSLARKTEVSKTLETGKSNHIVSKPIHGAGSKKAKKGLAIHTPLKLKKSINREYGEGSRMTNSERNLYLRERVSSEIEDSHQVVLPPSRPSGSSSGGGDGIRSKVKETLRLFHGVCRKLLQELEAMPQKKGTRKPRIDFEASKILKAKGKYLSTGNSIMGPVPGVEVGDEFQYRMELNILGVHRPSQGGIDYMKIGDDIFATSIVASGGYDDELDNSDVLTYTGQGGNVMKVNKKGQEEKEPEDQQLVKGNLALANSINKKNPVRVIRGNKKAALQGDAKGGNYVYDGLYVVEEYWQETGSHGMLVFKFKLRRITGQPELAWKVVNKSTKSKYREGLCKLDISEGKERLPISAVNEVDDEKPPMFTYTVKMIYPDWLRPSPPKACGCITRCTETRKCACVTKNGGEIPYNYDGAVVSVKNLIYECGPLCKCPSSCYLRVAQRGIRFQLEIFKTKSRGWGVRSLNSIPPGSFICEYVGELLEDKEAERRVGSDEYLFDIGNKYDNSLAEGMSELMPGTQSKEEDDDDASSGFTIDAAKKGNIGRFINHSCSPNLYAQNVLYDHEDARIPHVMFFAIYNIPPLQELCYHYNYMLDEVRDSKGNVKKKNCYCGSSECTGRLY